MIGYRFSIGHWKQVIISYWYQLNEIQTKRLTDTKT